VKVHIKVVGDGIQLKDLVMMQYAKSEAHYLFVLRFRIGNEYYKDTAFVRRSYQQMEAVFNGGALVNDDDEVQLLLSANELINIKLKDINGLDRTSSSWIHFGVSFVRVRDQNQLENFIAFIYDEISNKCKGQSEQQAVADDDNNFLMFYDMYKGEITKKVDLSQERAL
jgi:hypothetical protein